jgi:hypothetical protein
MEHFDMNQIGENKEYTINAYLARDKELGIKPSEYIVRCLSKLGYLNFNARLKINQYINNEICDYIHNTIDVISGNDIEKMKEQIKDSIEYKNFCDSIYKEEKYASKLSEFIGTDNIEEFYNSLTLDELNFLGY